MLIRPGDLLPLLFAAPLSELRGELPSSEPDLCRAAEVALGMSSIHLLGPTVTVPRRLLPLVLTRDVAGDAAHPGAVQAQLAHLPADDLAAYCAFLDAVRDSAQGREFASVFFQLWLAGPTQIEAFLDAHPALATSEALAYGAAELAADPRERPGGPLHVRQRLLENLHRGMRVSDAAAAYLHGLELFGQEAKAQAQQLYQQAQQSSEIAGLPLLREAHDLAVLIGALELEAVIGAELGRRLLADRSHGDNPDATEEAIRLLSRAVDVIPRDTPDWAQAAGNLANAYSQRTTGDQNQNWETAHDLLLRASQLDQAADPRTWATIQTNLGLLLAQRPGHTPGDVDRGIEHIEAGLARRSPDDNTVDWAYSMVNLGLLYKLRNKDGDLLLVCDRYRQALDRLSSDDDLPLWSTLQHNLADALLAIEPPDLDGAESAARSALSHIRNSGQRFNAARLTWVLAHVAQRRSGNQPAAGIELLAEAHHLTDPGSSPALHLSIGGELADAYAQVGDWSAAADVFASSVAALDRLYDAQTTPQGRRQVLSDSPQLARWAAFALARAGRPEQAIETIERGRARELSTAVSRDTADLTRLAVVDRPLTDRYRQTQAAYRAALGEPTGLIETARVREAETSLRDVIDEIRAVPGFDGFLRPTTLADIARIARNIPIVYLVNAPSGSYVLTVRQSPEGKALVESTLVPAVTSMTVFGVVLTEIVAPPAPGLLLAQSAPLNMFRGLLDAALQRLDALRPLIEPVAQLLEREPEHRCLIIPSGLLGLVPLHAVPAVPSGERVIDDVGDVYLAPSASLYAASCVRADQSRPTHLVAIANPDGTLPGSQFEIDTIRAQFEPEAAVSIQHGAAATSSWLLEQLPRASHLHLACHGGSTFDGPAGGTLMLAGSDTLTVGTMLNGHLPMCRLATASACQSGHYSLNGTPDEFTGLPAAFLQAGAACAVVSLWLVDDLATALLMTRFYELLAPAKPISSLQPVPALREARLWLRRLTNDQMTEYAEQRPSLAARVRQRNAEPAATNTPGGQNPLYAAPYYWAAFTAWGC